MIDPPDIEQQNHGVILDTPLDTDLFFGANDRVKHNVTIENRNWLPYFSDGELQIGTYFDTMGCVSFSANKTVEAVLNYLLVNGRLSDENTEWLHDNGYIVREKVNLSDRFTTAMSRTSRDGNTGGAVWWYIRNHGVVPESLVPWDRGRNVPQNEKYGDWYRNPDNLPQEAIDLGKEFVKRFDVFFERVPVARLHDALKHSPLQVFIPTACKYNEDRVQQFCGAGITHAVTLCDDHEPRNYYPLFDHYLKQPQETGQERFIRRVSLDYPFYTNGYVCTIIEKDIIPNQDDMPNNFVRVVKDKNSKATGFFVPAHSPETIENMARIYNKPVPKKDDGSIDWDKFVEGEVTFEKPLDA